MPSDTAYTLEIPDFLKRSNRDVFDYENTPVSQWPTIPVPSLNRSPAWRITPEQSQPIARRPLSGAARDMAAFQVIAAIKVGHNTFGKLRKHCATMRPALADPQIKSAIRRAIYLHKVELHGRTYSAA